VELLFSYATFFFLSGYVLFLSKDSDLRGVVRKRSKDLLVPYFLFALFFFSCWVFVVARRMHSGEIQAEVGRSFIGIFYGVLSDRF
jgi:fucose 4-O-acetylase-like acetyltransferase